MAETEEQRRERQLKQAKHARVALKEAREERARRYASGIKIQMLTDPYDRFKEEAARQDIPITQLAREVLTEYALSIPTTKPQPKRWES